ncbi:MAG: methyltransferase family protein [Steroidobacteraceae bacterium]
MAAPRSLIGLLWAAFVVCWLVLAQFNKKASRNTPLWGGWGVRVAILVGVLIVLPFRQHAIAARIVPIGRSLPLRLGITGQWLGVGLCLVGFGLAVWARLYLGRNWGMPMSLRQGHELVTSGPYAYVRHPIYTGIMLAMIGSAVTENLLWLLLFTLYFAYFLVSARTEEKMMLTQFPDAYPPYRRRTKMLIPFLF